MSSANKDLSNIRKLFASQYEIGVNTTYPIYRSPQNKTSYIKKIIVTNNTSNSATFDIGLYENQYMVGGNVFAAVTVASTTAASSTDGITWTLRTMPASAIWYAATYGNGVFVAVANSASTSASSTDGITWTLRTMPASTYWYSTVYGNGVFVAVANGTNTAASSTDGITWTLRTLPASGSWYAATYPQNSDFSNNTYMYKSVSISANSTQSIFLEIIIPPTHEIRARSTQPLQITVLGEA